MVLLPTVLGFVAGICGFVGGLHLLIGWQRVQSHTNLTFALLCFCILGASLATAALHQAQTVADYTRALKWQQSFALAAVVPLLWFMASTTGVWLRFYLLGMSGVALFALAVNLAAPFGIFFASIDSITSTQTWWGEPIPQPAAAVIGPWSLFLQVSYLGLILYPLYACTHQFRRGERLPALRLGLGVGIMLIARSYDRAHLLEGTLGLSLMVYGYLALILVMSLGFVRDRIELARMRQDAEAATRAQNIELEQRVALRTAQLQAANTLLERRRLVAESLGDLLDLLNADRPLEKVWRARTPRSTTHSAARSPGPQATTRSRAPTGRM